MIALPLLILSLAAGIFLLMKATREYLSGIFKVLAWLVILFSLLAIVGMGVHGLHHFRHMHKHGMHGWGMHAMQSDRQIIIKEFDDNLGKDSICPIGCCKMEGDSMVMDKGMCEKMMGKDACEKMCRERGRCIMSKDECAKMCGGKMSCCTDSKAPCCAGMGTSGEMKECCKKK
jgi:hypothetical protein